MDLEVLQAQQQSLHDRALVGVQGVKALKKLGFFTSGGQINSLKSRKLSKLIYFENRFDTNLFLSFKIKLFQD